MTMKRTLYLLGFFLLALIAPAAYQVDRLAQSLPVMNGEIKLAGLSAPASVDADAYAIPTVEARTREDAYRVLGWLHARDRLFQLDLIRRKSAGRLAELFGGEAVPLDIEQRLYGLSGVAEKIVAGLPADQKAVLAAYAEGINAWLAQAPEFPLEFRVLRYRPEPWRPADSLLVALGMFQTLGGNEREERAVTVMHRLLPPEVVAFLTPDSDEYAAPLLGGPDSRRPPRPVPVEAIAALLRESRGRPTRLSAVEPEPRSLGSNNWVVGGTRTADGRAIVADDMHLPLGVPNVWYRARLRYAGADLAGVTLPGVPLLIVGSNGRIAWGYTNVEADLSDLVKLEINPDNPDEYRTPEGWRRFETRTETVQVKDGPPRSVTVRDTVWGPVSPDPVLGEPVALRWTALDPQAVNLEALHMDRAETLEQAMAVMNRFGGPPQNVVLADARGHIAWTYLGFFPKRFGFDGSVAASWADGRAGWDGYIPPEELPRLVDPPEGFIATANNRTLGKDYPYVIGHGFGHSYRAHRIGQQLRAKPTLNEADLFALQLDSVSEFYGFYRDLALSVLDENATRTDPDLAEIKRAVAAWNGRLDGDSRGIALLVRWRQDLLKAALAPLLARCAAAEPGFTYFWGEQDTPLRALLREQRPETLPGQADWPAFLRDSLRRSGAALKSERAAARLDQLTWAEANPVRVSHPFSRAFAPAARFLDMPMDGQAGCNSFCLRVLNDRHGASERMVVSPNHPEDGILHMPGGQSGHPLSPHYRDQQRAWAEGRPLPFLPGQAEHRLKLAPE
jgi:penicillin amidase